MVSKGSHPQYGLNSGWWTIIICPDYVCDLLQLIDIFLPANRASAHNLKETNHIEIHPKSPIFSCKNHSTSR